MRSLRCALGLHDDGTDSFGGFSPTCLRCGGPSYERRPPEKDWRCSSCEHTMDFHDADGRCWFTVLDGLPETNLVCPCKIRTKEEGQ